MSFRRKKKKKGLFLMEFFFFQTFYSNFCRKKTPFFFPSELFAVFFCKNTLIPDFYYNFCNKTPLLCIKKKKHTKKTPKIPPNPTISIAISAEKKPPFFPLFYFSRLSTRKKKTTPQNRPYSPIFNSQRLLWPFLPQN